MLSRSISTRFNLALIVIVSVIMIAFAVFATMFTSERISGALDEKLDNYINLSTVSLQAPLWNFDHPIVEGYLDSLMLDQSIVLATVVSGDGTVISRQRPGFGERSLEELQDAEGFSARHGRVMQDGREIGTIDLVATRAALREEITTNTIAIVLLTLAVLVTITLASLLISRRYIVNPLAELQSSAAAIGGGDLDTDIRQDGQDEIAQLAGSFVRMRNSIRDLVTELRRANETLESRVDERTKEVVAAQQKLVDAIESTSEGFAFFDAQDRLVLHNARYEQLLYGESDIDIEPGMNFEQILRLGVEKGLVYVEAEDAEAFIQERLEQHRNPKAAILQRRGEGNWIQISERKTSDGGTVAVFSDVSELKNREADLTEKTAVLENLSNQLAKYLSPQIYASIFHGKQEVKVAANRKKLTVFFSDIEGFTETAERMESEELTNLLNSYLTEMSKIAIDHGATIDKYVGDAILIFFGDPESRGVQEDALACARMAIAMTRRLSELQEEWHRAGILDPLKCRIGIHTDYCTVGNFGSESRMDYTIIGRGVNTAARLEAAAEPGQILVSYATYAMIRDEIPCRSRGQVEVKGIPHPIDIYEIAQEGEPDPAQVVLEDKDSPGLHLDIDRLSKAERDKFAGLLRDVLDKLKDTDAGNKK